MKDYRVWTTKRGYYEVKAENEEEAYEKAHSGILPEAEWHHEEETTDNIEEIELDMPSFIREEEALLRATYPDMSDERIKELVQTSMDFYIRTGDFINWAKAVAIKEEPNDTQEQGGVGTGD